MGLRVGGPRPLARSDRVTVDLAARLAPHVDRLALCVHRPAAQDAEFLRGVAELKPPRPTILIVHARVLAYRAITERDAELMSPFAPRPSLRHSLDTHVDAGLLHPVANSSFEPTEACRACARLIVRIHGEIVDDLWHTNDALAAMADDVCASVPDGHPAFAQQYSATDPPDASPSHRLLNRITALRYLRSDGHVAALDAHDLSGPVATALTELWTADEPLALDGLGPHAQPEHADVLVQRGFASRTEDRWAITDDGRATRDAVEADTNARTAQALGDTDRLARFVATIEPLPGTDPRS